MSQSSPPPRGSIVAFEGRTDLVSTQLRLLPTSPQLLILPSVECYLKSEKEWQKNFDSRAFARQVQDGINARDEAARSFLEGAAEGHKRLVFINGGTSAAQALCVKEFMKYETYGNRAEAEALFDDIIRGGLSGLCKQASTCDAGTSLGYASEDEHADHAEDPIVRAMRAADALDRQTASLQPSSGLDFHFSVRPRSLSLPLYGYPDEFDDAAPFYVFGASSIRPDAPVDGFNESHSAPPTPGFGTPAIENGPPNHQRLGVAISTVADYSPSCIGESYGPLSVETQADTPTATPTSESCSIRSSDNVVYGEASVLDMRLSVPRNSIVRVKSVDRMYPVSPTFRSQDGQSNTWFDGQETPRAMRVRSILLARDQTEPSRPRTAHVRSNLPTVIVQPVPPERKRKRATGPKPKGSAAESKSYVDRGTDAGTLGLTLAGSQPLLSSMEDFVIFLKDEEPDLLLQSAVHAFRTGRHKVLTLSSCSSGELGSEESSPRTIKVATDKPEKMQNISSTEHNMISPDADEYDPFAYMQPRWQPSKSVRVKPSVTFVRPPTPAQTPPPSSKASDNEHKVCEFNLSSSETALSIQNALRGILAEHFPTDSQGYHQFQFSILPEFDELWKPIFRSGEPGSPQRDDGKHTQILAIGSQEGVKKEYSLAVTGRLEKVGRKSCDIAKTGRVDFRYLLANAMQAFTAQRLTHQTSGNPFTNPYLLATLILPHLETYLALHPEIQYLLLMYPPEHLGTVVALQKLIGIELLKVAQIVESGSKELPFRHIRGMSIGGENDDNSSKRSSPSSRSTSDVAVSKANYLLTSTATEKDIATFVSTVWSIEIDQDAGTTSPKGSLDNSQRKKKHRPPPLALKGETFSPFPKIGPQSPLSPTAIAATPVQPPLSPARSLKAHSIAEALRAFKPVKNKGSKSPLPEPPLPADLPPASGLDPGLDSGLDLGEESDDDMDERRLMPVFMQKTKLRKPNSRKALKFLGLD